MKLNRLFRITAFTAVVFAFIGCDEEFTEVGGEIINNPSNVEVREIEVNAYSQKINSIQTNNLTNYMLGVHSHPVYGESAASVVTQVTLSREDPQFGENIQLDSVVMTIPYFSTIAENTGDDEILYELDSIYGNESFKLSVYETSYFLNDLDPEVGFEDRQKYYSDQQDIVEQNIAGNPLFVEDEFKPSSLSYASYEIDAIGLNDTIVNTPALRIKLPTDYFKQKIIDKEGSEDLLNNSNFRNYLRSLLIKAEPNGTGGSQILLDFSGQNAAPKISMYYTKESGVEGETDRVRGSFDLNLTGNRFNTFKGELSADVLQEVDAQTSETGAENLYLKAQEGSMAVIELFPDAEELEAIRNEELLVNEADLTFYVNEDLLTAGDEPRRLYLYDLTNNTFLADYALDIGFNVANPDASLTTFSEGLAEDDNGKFYNIRITNHVSSIINEGAENVKLGLVIVPNINAVVVRGQQGSIAGSLMSATRNMPGLIDRIPAVNSLTPTGTILHGNMSGDEDKRLKLRIYYTNFN
ncbi:DUF4270 domain-containing protein [Christiangramia sabulilitoris]|uniref:DUF4270 domain-containing protein n=1 Tax=Christiangramia sabulilitoris TaxID=2583991 RepID=A0A550I0F8_9FLAO|nr:DUF4270 domain-containing protein [Christiangramia sabulilitoris]TRO64464.1 DUF4270 domain-containing protein [Christiangramia sabulilitoris]